jgi:hypothetical protein
MFRKELGVLAVLTNQSRYPGVNIDGQDLIIFTDGWDVVPVSYGNNQHDFKKELSKKYDRFVAANDGLEPIFVGSETNCHPWPFTAFYGNQTYDISRPIRESESMYPSDVSDEERISGRVASQNVCPITARIVRQQGGYSKGDRTHPSLINAGSYIGTAGSVTQLLQAMHAYGALAQDGEDQAPLYLAFLRSALNHGYDTSWPGADGKKAGNEKKIQTGQDGGVRILVDSSEDFFRQMVGNHWSSCEQLCAGKEAETPTGSPYFLHFNGHKEGVYKEALEKCRELSLSAATNGTRVTPASDCPQETGEQR